MAKKKKRKKLESTLVGVAGEYYVAAELSRRGYIASITLRNSRGIDIIVSSSDALSTVSIQVKTSSGKKPKWMLNKKSETYKSDKHFYVFVLLNDLKDRPNFHIVQSKVVSDYIYRSHRAWLAKPKKDGSAKKDTPMRSFLDKENKYKESWNLLGLG